MTDEERDAEEAEEFRKSHHKTYGEQALQWLKRGPDIGWEDIAELIGQCWAECTTSINEALTTVDQLPRVVAQVAEAYAKGREDAAKVCDEREADHNRYAASSGCQDWNRVSGLAREAAKCAARIRGK